MGDISSKCFLLTPSRTMTERKREFDFSDLSEQLACSGSPCSLFFFASCNKTRVNLLRKYVSGKIIFSKQFTMFMD